MRSVIKSRTRNFGFGLINFNAITWHDAEHTNWRMIDALLTAIGAISVQGAWQNNTVYEEGMRVIDQETSQIYVAAVDHVSSATGTFEDERIANPAYWSIVTTLPVYRGDWQPDTIYASGDIVLVSPNRYYFCVSAHTSSATFIEDEALWTLTFDAQPTVDLMQGMLDDATTAKDTAVSAQNASIAARDLSLAYRNEAEGFKNTAGTSATAASNSASAASTSATNAGNSATAAGTSETNASNSATASATSATNSQTARIGAETARDRAQDWAEKAVDVPVVPGEFSALHWATKAEDSAERAEIYDPINFVRRDVLQTATEQQKGFARANIGAGVLAGFRNKIINGDFAVAQRGGSNSTSAYGPFDRWVSGFIGGSQTVSASTFPFGQEVVPGGPIRHATITFVGAAGASNNNVFIQRMENVRILANTLNTVTFYARASTAGKFLSAEITQQFGSGGSAPVFTPLGKVALTTSWQRFDFVVSVPSINGKTLGTSTDTTELVFWMSAGSTFNTRASNIGTQSGTIDIAHVSIVPGDDRAEFDPFESRSYNQEFELCLRYYEVLVMGAVSYANSNTYGQRAYVGLKARKRAQPAVTVTVSSGGLTSPQSVGSNIDLVAIEFVAANPGIEGYFLVTVDAEI